jgi:hypothetical protein
MTNVSFQPLKMGHELSQDCAPASAEGGAPALPLVDADQRNTLVQGELDDSGLPLIQIGYGQRAERRRKRNCSNP